MATNSTPPKIKVGIIGCGNISPRYVDGCRKFDILDLVACADLYPENAQRLAADKELQARSVDDLLDDPDIQIIINLTIPAVHAEVSQQIIAAGKHVHTEKPLAVSREDGKNVLAAAQAKGVRVGAAPDTFLGGALQTCRKLIDDGWIGEVVGATTFMMNPGPELWHPNPGFLYDIGAGPLFDMGPYYLTALVHLLGPVSRVTGMSRITHAERIAQSKERFGERIPVKAPTYTSGTLQFASGPIGNIMTTFDGWYSNVPHIEIYGSQGTLRAPDPNWFGGEVKIRRARDEQWRSFPLTHSDQVSRGIGVADLAYGATYNRPHRANGNMAYHVLDIMHAIEESAQNGRHIDLTSMCDRPAMLPLGLLPGRLDAA